MSIRHAAVWLDHQEAKVYHVDPETFERSDLHVTNHLRKPHKLGAAAESHRSIAEEHPFFDEIAKHLAGADEILVVGPANTKLEFVKFMKERHQDVARKIVGVEPSDHPSDGQLVAHVRRYFLAVDRARAANP